MLDLFSRFVVGWAVSAINDQHLTLKATIEEVKSSKDVGKLETAMAELVAKYQGTPLEARVQEALGTRLAAFGAIHEAEADLATVKEAAKRGGPPLSVDDSQIPTSTTDVFYAECRVSAARKNVIEQLDSWCTEIQGQADALGTQDQLALIRIQELNSQITQATQLASNILAARDQAASTAIMNMKV